MTLHCKDINLIKHSFDKLKNLIYKNGVMICIKEIKKANKK